jgi:hypothetical protein
LGIEPMPTVDLQVPKFETFSVADEVSTVS